MSSSSVSASSSGSGSVTTSSTGSVAAVEAGTRPDPSTDFTEPPSTPVTNLSIDTYVTITEGTTKTYTSSRPQTSNMWVTVVRQGHTVVIQTTFAQRFTSQYIAEATPLSGSIGLGSLSGTVGGVRSDMQLTIELGNAQRLEYQRFSPLLSVLAFVLYFF